MLYYIIMAILASNIGYTVHSNSYQIFRRLVLLTVQRFTTKQA